MTTRSKKRKAGDERTRGALGRGGGASRPLPPKEVSKDDPRKRRPQVCPRCGTGAQGPRNVLGRYRCNWDGTLTYEQRCRRCGYTVRKRDVHRVSGHLAPNHGYGYHVAGTRGGVGTYAGYHYNGTAREAE